MNLVKLIEGIDAKPVEKRWFKSDSSIYMKNIIYESVSMGYDFTSQAVSCLFVLP